MGLFPCKLRSASQIGHLGQALSGLWWPDRSRGSRFSSQSVSSISFEVASRTHGIRVWRASLWDALPEAAVINGFSHPVVRMGRSGQDRIRDYITSCGSLRSEPELCATATMARRRPLIFMSRMPHAFKLLQAIDLISIALVA
jgi:hypothetical protein